MARVAGSGGYAGECTAGECTAGECTAGECTAGECTAGECTAGECTVGQAVLERALAIEVAAGDRLAEPQLGDVAGVVSALTGTRRPGDAGKGTAPEPLCCSSFPGSSYTRWATG